MTNWCLEEQIFLIVKDLSNVQEGIFWAFLSALLLFHAEVKSRNTCQSTISHRNENLIPTWVSTLNYTSTHGTISPDVICKVQLRLTNVHLGIYDSVTTVLRPFCNIHEQSHRPKVRRCLYGGEPALLLRLALVSGLNFTLALHGNLQALLAGLDQARMCSFIYSQPF